MRDDTMTEDKHSGSSPEPLLTIIPNGLLEANCYIVTCPHTRQAIVVDPGSEPERILAAIAETASHVARIVHTHGHFDHIAATEAVMAGLPAHVPIAAHPADAYLYERAAREMGAGFGYLLPETLAQPDEELRDCGELRVGDLSLEVIATPGHTPGSVSLRCGDWWILTGDTLFRRGIGRTDLPGGNEEAIYESILTRLYPLPGPLTVYPGHGPETTIEQERRLNPFVQAGT